jgi:pentatricopeptide repeat protein
MLMASLIRCAKAQEWQRALSLLNEMRTAGVAPDVITFNSALSALAKGGETSLIAC